MWNREGKVVHKFTDDEFEESYTSEFLPLKYQRQKYRKRLDGYVIYPGEWISCKFYQQKKC
jgi:hypothetical protein